MEPIPIEKLTLSNGLDIILHQDRSLPIVSVNVWYHVGSKDEQPGKTGFAHLFEHLMFEGTKHHNSSHFGPLQEVGATLNGSTTTDRTNYWENVPSNYLELALWLDADRTGFVLEALCQQRRDVQRARGWVERRERAGRKSDRVPRSARSKDRSRSRRPILAWGGASFPLVPCSESRGAAWEPKELPCWKKFARSSRVRFWV